MKRSFRYLLLFDRYAIPPILIFAAVVLGGNLLMNGRGSGTNSFFSLFVTYLNAWPVMCGFIVSFLYVAIYSMYYSLALSMGASRRDYFWANQLNFLLCAGFLWITQLVMDGCSSHFGWESMELWGTVPPSQNPALLPVLLLLMAAGSCLGLLYVQKPRLALFVMALSGAAFAALLVAAMFISGSGASDLWSDLPWLIPSVCTVLALLFDVLLWHFSQKTVVR